MNVHLLNSPAIIALFFLLIGMSRGYFFARRKIRKKQLEEHTKINVEREILEEKLKFIEDRNSMHLEMLATNKIGSNCKFLPKKRKRSCVWGLLWLKTMRVRLELVFAY